MEGWDALPWWQQRMYAEGLNEHFDREATLASGQQSTGGGDGLPGVDMNPGSAAPPRRGSWLDALYPGGDPSATGFTLQHAN